MEEFVHTFDHTVAVSGPPCVFLLTIEDAWRVEPDLSRDGWVRLDRVPERNPGYGLMRDRATGWVTRIYCTGRDLFLNHPRVDVEWFETGADMRAAYAAIGPLPLQPDTE
jgi:hypothetical protein